MGLKEIYFHPIKFTSPTKIAGYYPRINVGTVKNHTENGRKEVIWLEFD